MALFAKKDKDASAPKPPKASGGSTATADKEKKGLGGLSFGRKKADTAPQSTPENSASGGFEDFSDFAEDALGTPPSDAPATKGKKAKAAKPPRAAKPSGLKGGAVVGLNIGNDSIKAVEVKGKGSSVAVTAMGMIPTPPESISNGVVMSTTALSYAIKDLFQKSGIKTKRVVTSVSGAGALVVRVIEVPKMSDAELKGNMTQDADRYIPFPPTEVIMDFKALRELPTDPDSGNMEVLLAAAQREIVDLHINVLTGAKLEPTAIDVEPLAAARTLHYDGLGKNGDGSTTEIDYNDVSALINIGATNTEITVLRGDILVFTRSIPRGGNALTEALVNELGLAWPDAERLKQEVGDALPPHSPAPTGAVAGASLVPTAGAVVATDDAGFSGFDAAFGDDAFGDAGTATQSVDVVTNDDWSTFAADTENTPAPVAADATLATDAPPAEAAPTADPFDLDFFGQGPQTNEPEERHKQKQDDDKPFDFSAFNVEESGDAQQLPSQAETPTTPEDEYSTFPSLEEGAERSRAAEYTPLGDEGDLSSAFHPVESAPTGQMFHFDAVDDPSLPSFPSLPDILTVPTEIDDFDALPTVIEEVDDLSSLPSFDPLDDSAFEPPAFDPQTGVPLRAATEASTPASAAPETATPVAEASAPATTESAPVETESAAPASSGFTFAGFADEPLSAPAPLTTDALAELAGISTETLPSVAPDEDDIETSAGLPTLNTETSPTGGTATSAFDFSDFEEPAVAASAPAASSTPAFTDEPVETPVPVVAEAAPVDDFDLDAIAFNQPAQSASAVAAAPAGGVDDIFGGNDFGSTDFGDTDFGTADFGGMDDFGAGLVGTDVTSGITGETVYGVLHPLLEELMGEVRRSLEYFGSRYPDAGVRRIVLVGGGARLANIDAYFTQSLGIPTTCGNPFSGITVRAPHLSSSEIDDNSPLYAVALGLALRDLV